VDCNQIDEMMSLKLDGLLAPEDDRRFLDHVAGCTACLPVWEAMRLADSLLCESARELLPVPEGFTVKVMEKVAVSIVVRPVLEPIGVHVASPTVVLPSVLPPQFANGDNSLFIPEINLQEWQHRIGGYVRGVAAVALALAASFGVLLALLVFGAIQPDPSVAPLVETLKTFFGSLDIWATSLASGVGTQVLVVAGLVMGLMGLGAWQIVNSYHHAAAVHYELVAEAA